MQLRSRSGVQLSEKYTYHNKIGEVVTEEKWLSSPKVLRGQVDTALVVGEDWGGVEQCLSAFGRSLPVG